MDAAASIFFAWGVCPFDCAVCLYLHMKIGKFPRFLIAFLYLAFISVLFFLPGQAFPQTSWLDKIWFDKWIHVGLFVILMVTWSWAIQNKTQIKILVITAIAYGIFVEWVQHQFVANRSFDWGDWAADILGILLGAFVWTRYIKK